MKRIDFTNVKASTFMPAPQLKPGGYVCVITRAEDIPDKEYLIIEFDISGGEYSGHFLKLEQRTGYWHSSGRSIRSYKEAALPYFKSFIEAIERSNAGFRFDYDERTLINKTAGVVFGMEEYVSTQTGELRERLYAVGFVTVDDINNNNFVVPELRKYKPKEQTASYGSSAPMTPLEDDGLPF